MPIPPLDPVSAAVGAGVALGVRKAWGAVKMLAGKFKEAGLEEVKVRSKKGSFNWRRSGELPALPPAASTGKDDD